MYVYSQIQAPAWLKETKIYQKLIGFDWIIEIEGKLHKKYVPTYETKRNWFGKQIQVEVNRPEPNTIMVEQGITYYVDEYLDWRKITPDCKPNFKIMKKGDKNGKTG